MSIIVCSFPTAPILSKRLVRLALLEALAVASLCSLNCACAMADFNLNSSDTLSSSFIYIGGVSDLFNTFNLLTIYYNIYSFYRQ